MQVDRAEMTAVISRQVSELPGSVLVVILLFRMDLHKRASSHRRHRATYSLDPLLQQPVESNIRQAVRLRQIEP